MKLFKRSLLLLALIVIFYFMLLNVTQTVDVKYFFGDSGVYEDASLMIVVFLSILSGFFIGVFFIVSELMELRKRLKVMKVEIKLLQEEVDSHRNIVVNDVLDSKKITEKPIKNENKE